jgi:hemerythrin-like domain-containing protein
MMNFSNRICQTLHQEHEANLALLQRVEAWIALHPRTAPEIADAAVTGLLSELGTGMAAEVQRHFDFEEHGLFVYLDAIGEHAIGAHLTEEHSILRPLVKRLAETAREAASRGFDEGTWSEFRRLSGELCERMPAHIQKEEMALLPLIAEDMDSDTENQLYQDYLENA